MDQQTPQYATMDPTMYQPYNLQLDPKQEYKRDLQKTAGKSAMLLFFLGVGAYVLSFVMTFIYMFINIAIEIASGASLDAMDSTKLLNMDNGTFMFVSSLLPVVLADIVIIIIAKFAFKIKFSSLFTKCETGVFSNTAGVVTCLAAGAVGGIIALLYMWLFEVLGITIPAPDFSLPEGQPVALILMLAYVCVIGPIMEEIIFRGFVLKSLQKFGSLFAILFSSILFSLFHGNLVQFIPPFLIGVVLAIMTINANSIVPAIIAHIINNSFAMLFDHFFPEGSPYFYLANYIYMAVGFIIFGVAIILYWKKLKQISKGDTTYMKTGRKVGAALTSGWSIGYLIFYVVLVVGGMILMGMLAKILPNALG